MYTKKGTLICINIVYVQWENQTWDQKRLRATILILIVLNSLTRLEMTF